MLKVITLVIIGILLALLLICILIPRARRLFWFLVRDSLKDLWEIIVEYLPSKKKGLTSVPLFFLAIILVLPVSVLFIIVSCVAYPIKSILYSIKHPDKTDDILQFDKEIHAPRPVKPKKSQEEIEKENKAYLEWLETVRFKVPRKDLCIEPDEKEIIFYTPVPAPEIEQAIFEHLEEIGALFAERHYRLFFLPEVNRRLHDVSPDILEYYNPRTNKIQDHSPEEFTFADIQKALCIPERVNYPCFIRCKRSYSDPVIFSFIKIEISDEKDIVSAVKEYFSNVGDELVFYHIASDDDIRSRLDGLPADERFDDDVYLIGEEIKDRIAQLRSRGLSTLAIRKLIGDDADKPGKLFINKHNKLILTDFGNKEIKLEPLQKAVFFLFLRHPEGIYFKDLGDYREELGAIYREITGRDDLAGIQDSINKLTDPFNNSINEKCARIKNAFVSEFREEVAQWYFIDGNRGEKKSIKLPRELVTWEIKD